METLNTNPKPESDIVYTEYNIRCNPDQEPFVDFMVTLSPTQIENQYLVELFIETINLEKCVLQSLHGKLTASLSDDMLTLKYDDVSISLNKDSLLPF